MPDTTFTRLIEPPPVHFSMQAPGWYVLEVLAALLMIITAILWIRHYLYNRYRRRGISYINRLQRRQAGKVIIMYECIMLAKRIGMAVYGRTAVAGLSGKGWINFLNATAHKQLFPEEDAQSITNTIYRAANHIPEEKINRFINHLKTWISQHHAL